MRRKNIEVSIKRAKKTKQDSDIEDRLVGCSRREAHHIVYVGDLVERVLKSEFGAVLKALTAGRVSSELITRDSSISSDRRIGRLEMANDLWQDLEQFVLDRDKLQESLREPGADSVETFNYAP